MKHSKWAKLHANMHCFDPAHLVAPDSEDGLVDGPGVGVEADTDLQGDI